MNRRGRLATRFCSASFAVGAIAAIGACHGVTPDGGLDATLRVEGAQFVRGAMTDGAGPKVQAVNVLSNRIHAGEVEKPCSGALDPGATAVALGLDGDPGYWIVPAGFPDIQSPGAPSFHATLSFSPLLAPGQHGLVARAVDEAGRFGPPSVRLLTSDGSAVPTGRVVVSLTWDTESDLDLHVVDPAGVEVDKHDINSYVPPPPGEAADPDAWKAGGVLDFDSNASCVIDGRRMEDVVWTTTAPRGHYLVRVDTFSLCDEVSARWRVEALVDGASAGVAEGASFDSDTRGPHDRGAGVLALEFDVR